jgi:predicted glycoside hydrolase/deacetylase ChbG (UPF0249 family)
MKPVWSEGLSVVIPCYNQGALLEKNVWHIKEHLLSQGATFEIIVVNDGSTDTTPRVAKDLQDKGLVRLFTHEQNLGKGNAVKTGVMAALYPRVLFLDADLAIPIEETEKFLEVLEAGKDIVIASRFVPGHHITGKVFWYRKLLERVYWLLRLCIIGLPHIKDTQCGYKLFRRTAARQIFPLVTCRRFSFDTELLYIASLQKFSVAELPVTLQNPTRTSIRIVRDSLQMFFDLLKMRVLSARGAYFLQPQNFPQNISVDDFGISKITNERILEILQHPRLKRIAVMTNGSITEAEKEALLNSGKMIDIHLELPGSKNNLKEHQKLHGSFWDRVVNFFRQVLVGTYSQTRIEASWRSQILRFQEIFGRLPDGINSHEHSHFFPPFFFVAKNLAQEFNIPFVRFGSRASYKWHPVALVLCVLRLVDTALFRGGFLTSKELFSYDWNISPEEENKPYAEILYHVERDEEYVLLKSEQKK